MPKQQQSGSIIWSAICRNDIILAEAGEDSHDGAVIELAQKLLEKKPTAGWEYEKSRKSKLRGIKFHVYETNSSSALPSTTTNPLLIWSFLAVADITLDKDQVQSFLEKQVYITQPLRQDNNTWRTGPVLAVQADFAPILLQKMHQVSTDGKLAMVNQQLNTTKEIMVDNINLALANQESMEELNHQAENLNIAARQFKKKAKQVKRFQMVQNAKHGVLVGTVVTAGVAAVVVPPLVAIL